MIELSKTADVREKFERLYFENFDRIRGFIFRIHGVSNLSDLVQETFLRAWASFSHFEGRSSARTWLYGIARHVVAEDRRRPPMLKVVDSSEVARSDPNNDDNRERVLKALEALDSDHRTVVVLFYFEGFRVEEISETLEIPVGTVKSRLHYAKNILKEKLGVKYAAR